MVEALRGVGFRLQGFLRIGCRDKTRGLDYRFQAPKSFSGRRL